MPFSEDIRVEVRRRAGFQCCRCHDFGVEIHHIVPEAEGGPSTIDNAAPLCPNCHDRFGDNPRKRKEITQMRDWWYEVVKEKWPTGNTDRAHLNDLIVEMQRGQSHQSEIVAELRQELSRLRVMLQRDPQPDTIREVATGLATATRLGEGVYANFRCRNCGHSIGLMIGGDACPNCGTPIS